MRVHPMVWTAAVALAVVIGYDKLKGGGIPKIRTGS